MSDLIDVWFTKEQLDSIIIACSERIMFSNDKNQIEKLKPIVAHLEHCLQKRNTKQWDENV